MAYEHHHYDDHGQHEGSGHVVHENKSAYESHEREYQRKSHIPLAFECTDYPAWLSFDYLYFLCLSFGEYDGRRRDESNLAKFRRLDGETHHSYPTVSVVDFRSSA